MTRLEFIFLTSLTLLISCNGQDTIKANIIQCTEHDIVINYQNPWTKLPGLDSKKQSLAGVIDYSNGTSYFIKVTQDVSKEKISDEDYFAYTRDMMLKENSKNKLLEEKEIEFHGEKYFRQIFLMYTKRWGLLKHYYSGRRSGDYYYGIQISFPVTEENSIDARLPEAIVLLDKNVLIDGK